MIYHNFGVAHMCVGCGCCTLICPIYNNKFGKYARRNRWKEGRRIAVFDVLLSNMKTFKKCQLRPVPLTYDNVIGKMQKEPGGYLYVACQNPECCFVNMVPYGKTHTLKKTGATCFVVNTKIGTGKNITFVDWWIDKLEIHVATLPCFTQVLLANDLFNVISAMIDNHGGTDHVNNFLTSLNINQ